MVAPLQLIPPRSAATRRTALGLVLGAPLLAGCAGMQSTFSQMTSNFPALPGQTPDQQPPQPGGPPQQPTAVGTGSVRVGLILPLSAQGNAGLAAQSMKNAAEMALAEFQNPNIQLLIKDDAGTPQGSQQSAQQSLDEGAEIILGPLFALSVPGAAQVARSRGISVIAFSTNSTVAGRGVYLLSFLPESDVNRIIDYASGTGKRSFAALLPENAYGNVVEVAFQQAVSRRGGRVAAFQKYTADRNQMQGPAQQIAQALGTSDSLFLADDGDSLAAVVDALTAARANLRAVQLLGTGLSGFSARVLQSGSAGRALCRARSGRLPCLRGALPHALWPGAGAHGDARV